MPTNVSASGLWFWTLTLLFWPFPCIRMSFRQCGELNKDSLTPFGFCVRPKVACNIGQPRVVPSPLQTWPNLTTQLAQVVCGWKWTIRIEKWCRRFWYSLTDWHLWTVLTTAADYPRPACHSGGCKVHCRPPVWNVAVFCRQPRFSIITFKRSGGGAVLPRKVTSPPLTPP